MGMKIIIIDKNLDHSLKVKTKLYSFTQQIDVFKHGYFAIQAMKKKHYHLAIINQDIGVESGLMIARCLKKINPGLKVVIYSTEKFDFYQKVRAVKENYLIMEEDINFSEIIDQFFNQCWVDLQIQ